MRKRMPSLQGIVGALKRTDSQTKNTEQIEAGAQSARGPNNKPVQLANMKPAAPKPPKFTIMGHIKNKLSQGVDPAQQAKKKAAAAQKKKADSSSSEETSEDLTNIIPNTLREQGPGSADNQPFRLKIEYLERENRSLQSKLNYQNTQEGISHEIITNLTDIKNEISKEDSKYDEKLEVLISNHQSLQSTAQGRIEQLEKDKENLHGLMLINQQIKTDQGHADKGIEEEYLEEIQALKDNLDRKEYLLQYNEQKYFQYEKVLRALILNKHTPEGVKEQLREKIESQELFVPKDERKISNLVNQNSDHQSLINDLKNENQKLQNMLEELKQKAQAGNIDQNFMDNTIEQLSIFQNKDAGAYRNIELKDSHALESKSDRKLVKKLELSVDNLNNKLSKLKDEMQKLKDENMTLKASNDNHIYINEKLNKALKKHIEDKKKKKKTDTSIVQQKVSGATGGSTTGELQFAPDAAKKAEKEGSDGEGGFGGDISSIMIAPLEQQHIEGGQFTDFLDDSITLPTNV